MEGKITDYRDIKIISPYDILSIEKLEITAAPGEHVRLIYSGIIPEESKDEYVTGSKYNDKIKVCQYDDGQFVRVLFAGQPVHIDVQARNNRYFLTVEALSYTYDMDIETKRRSYQEPSMTYDAMIQSVIKSYNSPDFIPTVGKGTAINIFSLQYDETDWAYLKRMASRFGAVLVPEGRHDSPKFWFGLPDGEDVELEKSVYSIKKTLNPFRDSIENYNASVSEPDFTVFEVETPAYMYLGDNVTINNVSTKVAKSLIKFENGILQFHYVLMPQEGIRQNLIRNEKIIGLCLEGTVIGRQTDEIKIKLDIDNNNGDCGTRWFKYESNYTVGQNWGWYVMPEMGHFVGLFLPSALEEEAHSVRSIRRGPHAKNQDPRIKILGTHFYKELRMDNEQFKITTKDDKTGKMYLQMKEEAGIEIMSDKDILLKSKSDISVLGEKINIRSEDSIVFVNSPGSIFMDGETHIFNTLIDKKATTEGDLSLMASKKAAIERSVAGQKALGTKAQNLLQDTCEADPIDIATGNYFVDQKDIIVRGAGTFTFSRFYNALDNYEGVMGRNWHHNFEVKLNRTEEDVTIIWGDGRVEAFKVQKSGRIVSSDDPAQVIERTMDGLYITKTYAGETYTFDNTGKLCSVLQKNNEKIEITYDKGYPIRIESRSGYLNLTYFNGVLKKVSDGMGRFVEYRYTNDLLTDVRNINGGHTLYEYDSDYQITQVTDPSGNIMVKNVYDQKGRVIEQTMPEGGKVFFAYDDENRTTTFTERNDVATVYQRDKANRIVEKESINGIEKMEFDQFGNLTKYTDKMGNSWQNRFGDTFTSVKPNGDTNEVGYDNNGNIAWEKNPDGGIHQYTYNEAGLVIRYTDPLSQETSFTYDEKGNLLTILSPNGGKKEYTYDTRGNILTYRDEDGHVTSFMYDQGNRMTQYTRPMKNQTGYGYNEIDKVTEITYPTGHKVKRTYDACGLLREEVDEGGGVSRYRYLKDGKIAEKTDPLGNVTCYEYDVMGNLIRVKNPDGSEKLYKYNEVGNQTVSVDEEGGVQHYFYDANGNVIRETDGNGNAIRYEYDGLNRLVREIDGNFNETKYEYRYDGKVTRKTDALGGVTENSYDLLGRLIAVTNVMGAQSRYAYDSVGNVAKEINAYGVETLYEYDKRGNRTKALYSDGTAETMEYDGNGNIIVHKDRGGRETRYEYDEMDRVRAIINALGGRKEVAYSPKGKIEGVRDEQGHSTRYQYDLNGNLVEVVNAKGHSTKYRYDAMNRVTEVHQYNKDESGIEKELVTAYRYNKKGLVVQETDAKNQVTHYSYDPAGNLVEKEDRDGYTTQYTYDAVNNVTRTVYNDNKEVKYEYDSLNRVIGMMDWLGETSYELDGLGRVIKYRDCNGGIASYEWGLMNERKAVRYPDGQMVEYSYDSNGRMAQVKDDKAITKYVYTPGGEMERELLSNGQGTSYGYDGLGRVKELTHYGKNGEALDSREIGYDEAGRKTSVHIKKSQWVEEGGREHQERGVYSYAYDELGQLVKVTGPGHDTEHYSYDPLGNRIKKSITGSRRGQIHYVYDELNRLVEVRGPGEELGGYTIEEKAELTYDGRGNMIRIQSDGKNIGEYIYDGTNRLVRSATHEGVVASYAYDGSGRRVRKEIDGRNYDYLIDVTTPYNEPLAVTSEGIREKYIYGNKRLGTKGKEGMAAYYFHDEMGSLIRTTDEKGASTGQAELDAFGRVVAFGNVKDGIQSLMSFTGYENDQGTGLMYVQARYYMPELGRFVAEDQNKGTLSEPQSLNYYVHCINNPLKYVDRDGRAYVLVEAAYNRYLNTIDSDLENFSYNKDTGKGTFVFNGYSREIAGYVVEGAGTESSRFVVEDYALLIHSNLSVLSSYVGDSYPQDYDAIIAFGLDTYNVDSVELLKARISGKAGSYRYHCDVSDLNPNDILLSMYDNKVFIRQGNRDVPYYDFSALPQSVLPITKEQLLCSGWLGEHVTDAMVADLNYALEKYNIVTSERISHFIAQCLHETGEGKFTVEAGTDEYFRSNGYSYKYSGVGYLQTTHEYSYQAFATYKMLEAYPQLSNYATFRSPLNNSNQEEEYIKIVAAARNLGLDVKQYTDIVTLGRDYVADNCSLWEIAAYDWAVQKNLNYGADNAKSPDDISRVINRWDEASFEKRARYYNGIISRGCFE